MCSLACSAADFRGFQRSMNTDLNNHLLSQFSSVADSFIFTEMFAPEVAAEAEVAACTQRLIESKLYIQTKQGLIHICNKHAKFISPNPQKIYKSVGAQRAARICFWMWKEQEYEKNKL